MSLIRIDWNPEPRKVRTFALGLFPFGAVLFALSALRGHFARGRLSAGICCALGAAALAVPALGRWIYKGWMCVAFVVGTAVSNVLLAAVFYGIVTPIALLRRLLGKDPLKLRRGAGSLWSDLEPVTDKSRYERLY